MYWMSPLPMPLIKITRQGLCTIALLTSLLWGCIVVERFTVARARAEGYRALQDLRVLQYKRRMVPAAAPVPAWQHPAARSAIG
jgi:hypothetical protein